MGKIAHGFASRANHDLLLELVWFISAASNVIYELYVSERG
jgi:hypothetical protein